MANRDMTNDDTNADLTRLSDADDFKVAEGYPDIRGWDVKTPEGQKVGEVKDLVVSTNEMRVRYVDVEIDKKWRGDAGNDDDKRALLPIGSVELDDQHDDVMVRGMGADVMSYPRYSGQNITHQYETSIGQRMRGGAAAAGAAVAGAAKSAAGAVGMGPKAGTKEFYDHEHFDDQRAWAKRRPAAAANTSTNTSTAATGNRDEQTLTLADEQLKVGKQQVAAGEVAVRKTVETERVTQEVPVSHEEVTVERRQVTGADAQNMTNAQIGSDQEIIIPLMREEPVVQKQAVVREQIIVRKQRVTDNQTVAADLAHERVQVDGEKVTDDMTTRRGTSGTTGTTGTAGTTGTGSSGTGATGTTGTGTTGTTDANRTGR